MKLSKEHRKIARLFYRLKDYIDRKVTQLDTETLSHFQFYLFFIYGPVASYSDTVVILCKNNKHNAAYAILRSLYEAHFNIAYHSIGNSEKKLAISARKQFIEQLKGLRGINESLVRHKDMQSPDFSSLYNLKHLTELIELTESRIEAILLSNSLTDADRDPVLIEKATRCDEAKIKGASPGHFVMMYQMVYRLLSPYVHLDIQGLENFISKDEAEKYYFNEKPDNHLLIPPAIAIYVALVKDLYDEKLLIDEKPQLLLDLDLLTR